MRSHAPIIHTVFNMAHVEKLDVWPQDIVLCVGERPAEDLVGVMNSLGKIDWRVREETSSEPK